MHRTMTLSFPPLTRAIKMLVALNVGMYVLMLLLEKTGMGATSDGLAVALGLMPEQVVKHGWIWQLLTYSIIHGGFFHLFFNMLMLWMFGANVEGYFRGAGRIAYNSHSGLYDGPDRTPTFQHPAGRFDGRSICRSICDLYGLRNVVRRTAGISVSISLCNQDEIPGGDSGFHRLNRGFG